MMSSITAQIFFFFFLGGDEKNYEPKTTLDNIKP